MTLIVGILCSDGIVMATESASTDMDAQTKQTSNAKITEFPIQHSLFGGSGDVGLIQKIRERIGKMNAQTDPKKFRRELKEQIYQELKDSLAHHVPYPSGGFKDPPPAISLVGGWLKGGPFLIEYERNCTDTEYCDLGLGGFAAIGSGKGLAQALFRPYLDKEKNLNQGKIIAYRIISDAISISMFGLAHPIHIYVVDTFGKIQKTDGQEIRVIEQSCELWRNIEWDALGTALSPTPQNSETTPQDGIPEAPKT